MVTKSFDSLGLRIWAISLGKFLDPQKCWAMVNEMQNSHLTERGEIWGTVTAVLKSAHKQDLTKVNT